MNGEVRRKVTGRLVDRLAAIELERLPVGLHPDGGGLYLQVTSKTARSWVFRYRRGKKVRGLGLGPLRLYSLSVAREMARDAARLLRLGIDPIDTRKTRQAEAAAKAARNVTFWDACEQYIDSHQAGWKNEKHAAQWRATLTTYAKPVAGDISVASVDTTLMRKILDPIWRVKPETAGRVRGRIELVLNFAKAAGYRDGENPARWRGHLDQILPARGKVARVEHHAAMPWRELPAFYQALAGQAGIAALALRFAILTVARTGEVIFANPSEIDLETKIWTIPAKRMKAGRIHRVPLSAEAVKIIKACKLDRPYIFHGQKADNPLSNMSLLAVLRRMELNDITVHGFRSAFRDWATESTSHPAEAIELALAHTIASKTEAAYRRGDLFERRVAIANDWADYLTSPTKSERRSKSGTEL